MRRLGLAFTFFALALGTWAVLRFASPLTPEVALSRGFAELHDAKAVSGVVSFVTLLPQAGAAGEPLAFRGIARADLSDAPSAAVNVASVEADGAAGMMMEVRAFSGDGAYIRVEGLPPGKLGTMELSELTATWWKADAGMMDAFLSESAAPVAAEAADGKLWLQLRDLAFGGTMFTYDGTAARELIGKVPTHRITLGLTRAGADAFAKALRSALIGRALTVTEAEAVVSDAAAQAVRVTVWSETKSGRIIQARIDLGTADGKVQSRSLLIEAIDTVTPVSVAVPQGTKPLAEIFEALVPALKKP